jgi:predicted nucleic acid-binding protein
MANNTENKGTRKGEVAPPSISTEDMIYMEYLIQKEIVRLLKKESREGGEKALLAAIKLREERPYLRVLRFFCEHRAQ